MYDMILLTDLLTTLVLDWFFSENIIIGGGGTHEGCSAHMVDVSNYEFKSLMNKIFKPEESFIYLYVYECLESEITITSTRRMRITLDAQYEKADLNKEMTWQYQHLTPSKRENIYSFLNIWRLFRWNSWHLKYHPGWIEIKG